MLTANTTAIVTGGASGLGAATAAALTIGMALVSVAAVVASSATASTRSIVEDQVNADLVVTSATSFLPEQIVPLVEGVESVEQLAVTRFGFGNSPDLDDAISMADLPLDAMGTLYEIPLEAGELPQTAEEILVQLEVAEDLGLEPGDDLGITTLTGSERYTVAGIANEQFFGTDVIVATETFDAIVAPDRARLTGIGLTAGDVVVGIAASGRTPYVIGGLDHAREVGAVTVSIAGNPDAPVSAHADIAIEVDNGPEVLTGSTRLKAGTSQKLILNMISTATMVQLGKTYGNLMVDVTPTNVKLIDRAVRIVREATGCDEPEARRALDESGNHAKTAIVMVLCAVDAAEARRRLDAADGFVRAALAQA